MVSTANPHASRAALDILQAGGNALDAAIAAQMALSVVEPQSSGIGGGLFLLHWDDDAREIVAWDGREKAPMAAGSDYFLKPDGSPMKWGEASIGGRAVGVPGTVAALWAAHRDHGKLDWARLFAPAITLARDGFAVSPRLHAAIAKSPKLLVNEEATGLYYTSDSSIRAPLPVGTTFRNTKLADTLEKIAEGGPEAFYTGEIAQQIVEAVRTYPGNASVMQLSDLEGFAPTRREAICAPYRAFRVCGMPPPTSGGLTTLMILGMLESYDIGAMRPQSATAVHLFAQASRLAYADRALYMADADFADVPVEGLLDKAYLRQRAGLIDPARDMGSADAGRPAGNQGRKAADSKLKEFGTTHLAIVDGEGNAVSMTSSVERSFGSHISVAGFILNSQLTDFSFIAERDGAPVANRVAGGKRPRSSMSPTLVFDSDGALYAVVGSPGGSRIIEYVSWTLLNLIDWDMDMQAAISAPRVVNRNSATEVEAGKGLDILVRRLKMMNHRVKERPLVSGLHGVRITDGGMDGGADPRREGVVLEIQ